jgi:hypothetical protein
VKYGATAAMNKTLEQIFEENNLIPKRDIISELMKMNELIKMKAEMYAMYNGEQMDNSRYFAFIEGARYALELLKEQIEDEL